MISPKLSPAVALEICTFFILLLTLLSLPSLGMAQEQITISMTLGLTGKYSKMANIQEKSYRLWANDTNKKGGILGRRVILKIVNDESNPQIAADTYTKFVHEEKVDLLFAPFSSEITKAIMPIAEQNNYPIIAAGAASDSLWKTGYKYIFGVFTPASKITISFLEMLLMKDLDNLAIFYAQDPFSEDTANGCIKWADRFGLTVTHIESFKNDTVDYNTLNSNAKKSGSQVIIMCGHLNEAIKMRQAINTEEWTPKAYYASQGPNQEAFKETLKDSANFVFGTEQWEYLGGIVSSQTKAFFQSYRSTYNAEPDYFAATAYTAGQILKKAILEAGTFDRRQIRSSLARLDFDSLLGRYRVNKNGQLTKNSTLVTQLQNFKTEIVWPAALMSVEPVFQ